MSLKRKTTIDIGDTIPGFVLKDQKGKDVNIEDYRGKKLVIYFYPKDESGVCTKEACAFRDSFKYFENEGATVIGINSGSVDSHKKFADHHNLTFRLLSDPGNKILKSFGVKNVLFLTGRETFVVDEQGKVVYKYRGFMNGDAHADKTLKYLKNRV
ncbi:peroxiredoxin [uncultured Chryseobacterium sp.]|uniref:peroxiredoxin n=1 Tax=uncultured Chryseobacterium sp. TaxID=259322 RepID=UPI0025CF31CA|nr:peroxiredoxin [uncultured Chryseobacterium sp.]